MILNIYPVHPRVSDHHGTNVGSLVEAKNTRSMLVESAPVSHRIKSIILDALFMGHG